MLGGGWALILALAAPTLGACPAAGCPAVDAHGTAPPGAGVHAPGTAGAHAWEASPPGDASLLGDAVEPGPLDLERFRTVLDRSAPIDALVDSHLPGASNPLPVPDPYGDPDGDPTEHEPAGPGADPAVEPARPSEHAGPARDRAPAVGGQASADGHASRTAGVHARGQALDEDARRAQAIGLAIGLLAIGLYHRLTKDEVLDHPSRRRILSALEEKPGLGTNEVADRLDVSYRTARHHLEKLAEFGLVAAAGEDRRCRWCLPGDAGAVPEPVTEEQERVLELVDREQGLHLSEIARRLGMAKATAKFQLDQLAERGLVDDEEVGPLRRFAPTDAGRERLSTG